MKVLEVKNVIVSDEYSRTISLPLLVAHMISAIHFPSSIYVRVSLLAISCQCVAGLLGGSFIVEPNLVFRFDLLGSTTPGKVIFVGIF